MRYRHRKIKRYRQSKRERDETRRIQREIRRNVMIERGSRRGWSLYNQDQEIRTDQERGTKPDRHRDTNEDECNDREGLQARLVIV